MSLFTAHNAKRDIVDINHVILYAITIHPHKVCKFNRKNYGNYTKDQQIVLLGNLERNLRLKNPSIQLVELHYEIAPASGNIHLHGLYSMPSIFQSTIVCYYRRALDVNNENTKVPWRHLYLIQVDNKDGWLQYIRKDPYPSEGSNIQGVSV